LVKQNHDKGIYGAPLIMLEIFSDDEEIPDELVNMLLKERAAPPDIIIYTTQEFNAKWEEVLKDFIENNKN